MKINSKIKYTFHICFFIFSVWLSGCAYLSIAFNNVGDAIFESPREVKNKIKNPIKNGVRLSVLWAGHSTMLVQMYDKSIIFDPYFDNHLGGIFLRRVEAGLDMEHLNQLDYICISHSHMDHLCFTSIGDLSEKFPGAKLIFPYGVEKYLPAYNIDMFRIDNRNVTRDRIGKTVNIDSLKITPVFAAHSGGRYALDVYTWKVQGATGYILEYKDLCIYFAGDTGYDSTAFKKIGREFNIELAFIPVGPCRNCDSVGFYHHTSSLEALDVLRELKAKHMIPMHYGSIRYIRDENYPIYILKDLLKTTAYSDLREKIKILKEGEQIIFDK